MWEYSKMKQLGSIESLMKKYKFSRSQLLKIMHGCIKYYLSEDELADFILEETLKKEKKKNKRVQD